MNRGNRAALVSSFVAAVIAQGAGMGVASAQTAEAAKPADELAEVTVTGSRIRRSEFTASSPVLIITNEETSLEGLLSTTYKLRGAGHTVGGVTAGKYVYTHKKLV